MNQLPQIASLWIGSQLSWLEQLCLKSFADAGHHITLYSYMPITNLPNGVHAGDAAEVYRRDPILRHVRTGSPAIHADLWRLHLLKKTDKIWVDADVYCYRPFDFETGFIFGWEKPGLICNAVLGLPKTSKALDRLLGFFEDEYAIAPWLKPWQQRELESAKAAGRSKHMTEQDWGFTGPASVTWFLEETGESDHALTETTFYPIAFRDRNKMIQSKYNIEERLTPQTKGIHFWARRMKPRLEERENNRPGMGSFMAGLIDKHGIDVDAALIPPKQMKSMAQHPVKPMQIASTPLGLLLSEMNTERLTRVVDVGANPLSPPPYALLLEQRGCEVWGFEPHPQAYEELQKTKTDLETYFPYAVGDGSEEVLNIYRESGLTSIFKPYEGAMTFLGRSRRNMELLEEVHLATKSLDTLEEVRAFDVLKIDVQGAELKVFQGARAKLASAMVVIPEIRFYQLYEGEPMLGRVDTELRDQGFQLHKFLFEKPKVIPNSQIDSLKRTQHRNQIIDGDGVYVRDLGKVAQCSSEQLKHLAIAATSMFASFDLALFCLDELVKRAAIDADIPAAYATLLAPELRKN